MGFSSYSTESFRSSASAKGYDRKSKEEIFTQRNINNAMDPFGIMLRESRDSDIHPLSVPIILGLDVTGSMGSIPHQLIQRGLPTIMETIIQAGIQHPQLMFIAIGDHECDTAPLQVGQFESGDELLMKWLTDIWLEGRGGGNDGESYLLAWYLAATRTQHDAYDKRGKKGFLFTIGDEPTLKSVSEGALKKMFGEGQYQKYDAAQLLDMASEKYHVYHLHVSETRSGSRRDVVDGWKQLLQENLIIVDHVENLPRLMTEAIVRQTQIDGLGESPIVPINDGADNAETVKTETSATEML